MSANNMRKDITVEKCVELYEKHGNKAKVARILNVSWTTVDNRLKEAEKEQTGNNNEEKRAIAHKICTEYKEELAELLLECMGANYSGRGYDFIKGDD